MAENLGSGITLKVAEKRLVAVLLCEEEIVLAEVLARRELDKSSDGKEPVHALTLADKAQKALGAIRGKR